MPDNPDRIPSFPPSTPPGLKPGSASALADQSPGRSSGRAPRRRTPPLVLPLRIFFLVMAVGIAALSLLTAVDALRLRALREENLRIQQEHDERLRYYADMRRSSGFEGLIRRFAEEYGVNPSFVSAVISRESHFDARAESRAGARGLMQIMEDTGLWASQKLRVPDYSYGRLFEPELNIRFGTWYLAQLSSRFAGSPVMILCAYHAGPGNAERWALRLAEDRRVLRADQIPAADTRDYVGKVMNAYALYYEYDSAP